MTRLIPTSQLSAGSELLVTPSASGGTGLLYNASLSECLAGLPRVLDLGWLAATASNR